MSPCQVAARWSNHLFKENFPSSKKRSHIIGLRFPAYHCSSSHKTPNLSDISSRSRETTFSHEDHRFQLSSVDVLCLRAITVLCKFTGSHWAVVGRTLIWASWCGPVCCVDIHSDSSPGCSWGWTKGAKIKRLFTWLCNSNRKEQRCPPPMHQSCDTYWFLRKLLPF